MQSSLRPLLRGLPHSHSHTSSGRGCHSQSSGSVPGAPRGSRRGLQTLHTLPKGWGPEGPGHLPKRQDRTPECRGWDSTPTDGVSRERTTGDSAPRWEGASSLRTHWHLRASALVPGAGLPRAGGGPPGSDSLLREREPFAVGFTRGLLTPCPLWETRTSSSAFHYPGAAEGDLHPSAPLQRVVPPSCPQVELRGKSRKALKGGSGHS